MLTHHHHYHICKHRCNLCRIAVRSSHYTAGACRIAVCYMQVFRCSLCRIAVRSSRYTADASRNRSRKQQSQQQLCLQSQQQLYLRLYTSILRFLLIVIPQTVLAHGVLTWFLLDRFACKDFPSRPSCLQTCLDLPNSTFCVLIKFHDLPESDLRYTTISSQHVLRRKYFTSRFVL